MSTLDYKFLECTKNMPPLKHSKNETCFDIQSSDVARWIMQQPEVMQKVFDMANRHGFIKYNPETKTWQGVDYHAD